MCGRLAEWQIQMFTCGNRRPEKGNNAALLAMGTT